MVEALYRVEGVIDRLNLAHGGECGIGPAVGIETDLEQPHEAAGNRRICVECILHIGLAECGPDLTQNLGV